ncbi:hypothetical protein NMY22_g1348 [Coprinellus aureogranulatus]|nr:hypothetical protein NMY22_g1348 [Coprinellus aureogranulatus]
MPISNFECFVFDLSLKLRATVFGYLSKPDLNRLSRASLFLHSIVEQYCEEAWDITAFLQTWFPNSTGDFRVELARTGAIVTGSQVLRFFDRQPPDPSCDLDIVTRVGGVLDLCMYLEMRGYTRSAREPRRSHKPGHGDDEDGYPILTSAFALTSSVKFLTGGGRTGIVDIIDYVFPDPEVGAEVNYKVQLIVVLQPPVEHVLFGFHSMGKAGVINFLNHKEAVSVFPYDTFISRVFRVCSRDPLGVDWDRPWARKYRARGFHIETFEDDPPDPIGKRSINDKHCWVMPFKECGCGYSLEKEFEECEPTSRYLTNSYQSIDFDIIPLYECGRDAYTRRYRIAIQEPDLWYYLWPWYSPPKHS